MATKAAIAASRIRFMQIAIVALERELEGAEGLRKEALERWLTEAQQALRQLGHQALHLANTPPNSGRAVLS